MTDLDNLRKRAKQLVRDHRNGSYLLPDRLRRSLQRFAAMSDREVLDAPFALHDAQELIAVEHGFATWAELKEARPMSTTSDLADPPEVRCLRALPMVFVRDIDRSVAWYRDVLGFTVIFTYGEPPFFAEIRRGDAALNLRHTDVSPWAPSDEPDLLTGSVATTDAKALFLEHEAAGAAFHQRLRQQPWGDDYIVQDPDGNLVQFGSGIGTARSDELMRGA